MFGDDWDLRFCALITVGALFIFIFIFERGNEMAIETQNELELLLKRVKKAYEDDVDFDESYKLLKKALKIAPKNPEINVKFAISMCYADANKNDYELSQHLFVHVKRAAENGLMELCNSTIKNLIGDIIVYCIQTNETLHANCKRKKMCSHKELVVNIRAIEMHTGILEYVSALIEQKNQGALDFKSYYLDCLKEISLRLSIMFGKYICKDCSGLCESTRWNYLGDLETKFEEINQKILAIDPKYNIPHKKQGRSNFSIFISKLTRDKKRFCKKCNKKLTTEDLQSTKCLGLKTTENSVDATLFLTFKCTECEEMSGHALKGVTLKWVDSNGWIREYSIEDKVADYLDS